MTTVTPRWHCGHPSTIFCVIWPDRSRSCLGGRPRPPPEHRHDQPEATTSSGPVENPHHVGGLATAPPPTHRLPHPRRKVGLGSGGSPSRQTDPFRVRTARSAPAPNEAISPTFQWPKVDDPKRLTSN